MNFQNKTTTSQSTNSNNNNGNQSSTQISHAYPKLVDEVNIYWHTQINEMEKIRKDIIELERMFSIYGNNNIFINCKEVLTDILDNKQDIINNLEEQFYILKRNFNII